MHFAAINGHEAVKKLLNWWPIYQKNLAFCCAQHPRLGEQSSAYVLPNELFYEICKLAKPTIEDADKE